jgi:hypothetical protein
MTYGMHKGQRRKSAMTTRQRIEERIRKKDQEIQEHENNIRDARVYIEALKETLRMLPKDDSETEKPESKLRAGSKIAKVYAFLKKTGHPLHISALLEGIGEPNTKENRLGLSGSLGAYVRNEEIFTRTSPNTFGLKETNGDSSPEPPENFGIPVGVG